MEQLSQTTGTQWPRRFKWTSALCQYSGCLGAHHPCVQMRSAHGGAGRGRQAEACPWSHIEVVLVGRAERHAEVCNYSTVFLDARQTPIRPIRPVCQQLKRTWRPHSFPDTQPPLCMWKADPVWCLVLIFKMFLGCPRGSEVLRHKPQPRASLTLPWEVSQWAGEDVAGFPPHTSPRLWTHSLKLKLTTFHFNCKADFFGVAFANIYPNR